MRAVCVCVCVCVYIDLDARLCKLQLSGEHLSHEYIRVMTTEERLF